MFPVERHNLPRPGQLRALDDLGIIDNATRDPTLWEGSKQIPIAALGHTDEMCSRPEVLFEKGEGVARGETMGHGEPGHDRKALDKNPDR